MDKEPGWGFRQPTSAPTGVWSSSTTQSRVCNDSYRAAWPAAPTYWPPSEARPSALRAIARELLGYGLASAAALAADTSVLLALVTLAGWHYLAASVVAFICGGVVAYVLSVRFVFKRHRVQSRPWELGAFLALGVVGVGINSIVLFVGIERAGMNLLATKLCAALCTFAANFVLRRQLLFVQARRV
jgi:putative flippase GtrA